MSNIDDKISEVMRAQVERIRAGLDDDFHEAAQCCESEIERLMLARLMFASCGIGWMAASNRLWPYNDPGEGPGGGATFHDPYSITIVPQWKAGRYKADFLVLLAVPCRDRMLKVRRFIVECDGHDFHEKTKEQAARDKKRDRYFAGLGCHVFRYTGSEIWKNAEDLLDDLETAMWQKIDEER